MTILVTGGAGYIGSHTVRLLVEQGRDVVVLDTLELGLRERIAGVELVQGDVADHKLVDKVVRKYGVTDVIHFAAYKAVGESMEQPLRYWNNNVGATIALVHALLAAGVNRIVFSSSAGVYGNPDTIPVTEDERLAPASVYAETKATMERFLLSCDAIGLRSVSLRYFNAAGASDDASIGENWDLSQNLVPRVMKAILGASGPLQVFGNDYPTPDGTCIRDYIHILDLAQAHMLALTAPQSAKYNLGTGGGTSVREIIATCEKVTGKKIAVIEKPRRPGDPPRLIAGSEKVRAELGWKPQFQDVEKIIASAWAWHVSHPNGYGD
jgi:UDP-glucose 4-epimerase